MLTAAVPFVLILAALPVRVVAVDCPSGAEVEQALTSMLSADPGTARHHVARVERMHDKLRVELADGAGSILAERFFDGTGTCSELAKMAAIFIASWESDVHPEFVRPHAEPPAVAPRVSPPGAAPAAYEIGVGVSLSEAASLAVGGLLGATWLPRGVGLGFGLVLAGETTRSLDLDAGQARWRRWTASPEICWRWARHGLALDVHGGITLAWLAASGLGFDENIAQDSFSLGATLGLRFGWWVSRHVAAWVDVRGFYFTRTEILYVSSGTEAEVPRLGGILSIGVAFARALHAQ